MDINIDSIHVTVAGDDLDKDEIVRELQWHLTRVMEELSKDERLVDGNNEIEMLDLPEMDWEGEVDKTGKLIQLINEALEGDLIYGA